MIAKLAKKRREAKAKKIVRVTLRTYLHTVGRISTRLGRGLMRVGAIHRYCAKTLED